MASAHVKSLIIRVFSKTYGLSLKTDAVQYLGEIFDKDDIENNEVQETLEWIAAAYVKQDVETSIVVTRDSLEAVVYNLHRSSLSRSSVQNAAGKALGHSNVDERGQAQEEAQAEPLDASSVDPRIYFHVVDAFDMPKWVWNSAETAFQRHPDKPTIFPGAASKIAMFLDRFHLIRQRLLRNESFRPPPSHSATNTGAKYMKITAIKSLRGHKPGRFLLFGMLTSMSDGKYYLEDPEGMIELQGVHANTPHAEGLILESLFLLVEGIYTLDRTFRVTLFAMPPSEPRETTLKSGAGANIDFWGAPVEAEDTPTLELMEVAQDQVFYVVISDLWLDHPMVLVKFATLLEGFVDMPPLAFILIGSFHSQPYVYNSAFAQKYRDNFSALYELLAKFPTILSTSKFVFVPGPHDPSLMGGSTALPQPRIPSSLVGKMQRMSPDRCTWASNPCRIKYFTQETVIFRDDLLNRCRRNLIMEPISATQVDPNGTTETVVDERKHLAQTLLDQSHLSPLALQKRPIYWDFDHALRLYPLPHSLILADRSEVYHIEQDGVVVMNPGPFPVQDFHFLVYYPGRKAVDASQVP